MMRHRRRILVISLLLLMLLLVLVTSQTGQPFLRVTVSVLRNAAQPLRLYRQLQLRCDIESSPPLAADRPDVQHVGWVLNDDLYYVGNDKRFTVYREPSWMSSSMYTVLTINAVTEKELGVYMCEARNTAGMYSADRIRIYKGPEHILYVEKVTEEDALGGFYDNMTTTVMSSQEVDSQDEISSSAFPQCTLTAFTLLLLHYFCILYLHVNKYVCM